MKKRQRRAHKDIIKAMLIESQNSLSDAEYIEYMIIEGTAPEIVTHNTRLLNIVKTLRSLQTNKEGAKADEQ